MPLIADSMLATTTWSRRLEALGQTLLRLDAGGRVQAVNAVKGNRRGRGAARLLVDSPVFAAALQRLLPELQAPAASTADSPGNAGHVVMPGVRVVRLIKESEGYLLAMLVDDGLLFAEQLRGICDQAQVDFTATRARLEAERLPDPDEASRQATMLSWVVADHATVAKQRGELRELSDQLTENYEELSLLYRLSCGMTLDQPADLFLRGACNQLQEVSGLDWLSLHLSDEIERLNDLLGRSYWAGFSGSTEQLDAAGQQLMRRADLAGEPLIIDDTRQLGKSVASITANLLIVPLVRDGQTLGVILGGPRGDGQPLDSTDSKLCASMGNSLAIFLENHMLYGDAQSLFTGTLHALTSAIDAKDSYTFGHSARVALLSAMLAEAAGHPREFVERIELAAQVHDVGKIGVPEAVLCKPGRLTDDEFEIIKTHPTIGANILRDIRQMADLIPGVLYHHEHWSGRGYPAGLAGRDIPIFGRIIGLCDAFDAMSSNRTYRAALDHEVVLREIRQCAGRQFDPDLAQIFVKLDFTPFFEMLRRHHDQLSDDAPPQEFQI